MAGFDRFSAVSGSAGIRSHLFAPCRRERPKNARGAVLYFGCAVGAICATNATRKEYGANRALWPLMLRSKEKSPYFGGSIVNVGGSNCPVNSSGTGEPAVNRGAGNIVVHAELCDSTVNITFAERFRRADKVHGFHGFDDPRLFHSP